MSDASLVADQLLCRSPSFSFSISFFSRLLLFGVAPQPSNKKGLGRLTSHHHTFDSAHCVYRRLTDVRLKKKKKRYYYCFDADESAGKYVSTEQCNG
jgi:hypothetical protein